MCELIPAAEPLPLFVKKKKGRCIWKFGVTSTLTGFNVKDIDSIRKQQ